MVYRSFLVRMAISATALVVSVVMLNALVDPYALFEWWRSPGINDLKPYAATRVRTSKPYQMMRARPRTLIMGNSRPELGIDPKSACWTDADRPVYNAGIPGIGVYQQARLVQSSLMQGAATRVVWALDVFDFIDNRHAPPAAWPPPPASIDRRLPTTAQGLSNPALRIQWLRDVRDATLSLNAMGDSLLTLVQQRVRYGSTRRSDGFNPGRDYQAIVDSEGQGVLFEQKTAEVIRRLSPSNLTLYPPGHAWSTDFESLRHVLALASSRGVRVDLVINPYHADYLAVIELSGNWHLLEEWKRRLVETVAGIGGVTLWDFNAFDAYSSQLARHDMPRGEALRWYWEPAHYRVELGNRIIARLNATPCDGQLDPAFGVMLKPDDVDRHLQGLRDGMLGFAQRFPTHWQALDDRVARQQIGK